MPGSIVVTAEDLEHAIRRLGRFLDGKPMRLTLVPIRPGRSLEQNSMLHALFQLIADHTGHTLEEVKDFCKGSYGPRATTSLDGTHHRVTPKSTAKFTVGEMAEFIERTLVLCAELGIETDQEAHDAHSTRQRPDHDVRPDRPAGRGAAAD